MVYRLSIEAQREVVVVGRRRTLDENIGRGITLKLSQGYAVYNLSLIQGATDPRPPLPKTVPVEVGSLTGSVLEKTEEGLQGIPAAQVRLRKEGSLQWTEAIARAGDSNNNGRYELVLEAGSWHASVVAPGFETFVDPTPLVIRKGEALKRDFVLVRQRPTAPAGQGIKGVITVDEDIMADDLQRVFWVLSCRYDPLRSTFAIWIETWLNEFGIPLEAQLAGFNVIVPIIFKGKEQPVLAKCRQILERLTKAGIRAHFDDRDRNAGRKRRCHHAAEAAFAEDVDHWICATQSAVRIRAAGKFPGKK